ncbi:Maternal protein pumilio [Pelomyxa schiedti]|nr:Maternal protein pumilio [Pelomyxa schiedti]KAH3757507.1 Maternal protein pumilio [Pelomyxa schiedti]
MAATSTTSSSTTTASASASGTPGLRSHSVTTEELNDFRAICGDSTGWELQNKEAKYNLSVWTKKTPDSEVLQLKLYAEFEDVPPEVMYDVVLDTAFGWEWDEHRTRSQSIANPCPYVEYCYYAAKMPNPLRPRDWVLLYLWGPFNAEESIMYSRSVAHPDWPETKDRVRARSLLSGYQIKKKGAGVSLNYIAQNDWNGAVPVFLVNQCTRMIAPSIIDTLHKACLNYPTWKATHNPEKKTWHTGVPDTCGPVDLKERKRLLKKT